MIVTVNDEVVPVHIDIDNDFDQLAERSNPCQ